MTTRTRRIILHVVPVLGMWLLVSGCLLPVLMVLGRGHLGWAWASLLAALIGSVVTGMAVLADDVPEDSKYDA